MGSQPPTSTGKDRIKLDNNEGGRLSDEQARDVSLCGPPLLREYPSTRELESLIASQFDVDPSRVMVTAGADDAIDRCFRVLLTPGRSLILTAPTFQQFHRFAATTPAAIREVGWDDVFPVDDILERLDETTALVAFATPNNPTGMVAVRSDLERIATGMANGHVLLDHAYVEYAEEDFTRFATSLPNVIVVRTFSKAWGMAGCRVGYVIAPQSVAPSLRAVGNPYPVAGPSAAMVTRRFERSHADMEGHIRRVHDERARLQSFLAARGVSTTPSQANFVFADFGNRVRFVQDALASRNISVRAFPDRNELRHGLRISLPDDPPSFDYLLESLRVILDPEALLLDMDGVVADVSQSYDRCIRETVAHFGVQVTAEEIDAVVLDGDANNDWVVVQRLLGRRGRDISLAEIRAYFQSLYEGADGRAGYAKDETPVVSARDLRDLSGGRKIGIVTGRPRAEAVGFLERFALTSLVDALVCMEDAPAKPDPAPVRLVLDQLNVTRAWMVGDSPDDIVAARSAGVLAIGTASSATRKDALLSAGAAAVVPGVFSLGSYLS